MQSWKTGPASLDIPEHREPCSRGKHGRGYVVLEAKKKLKKNTRASRDGGIPESQYYISINHSTCVAFARSQFDNYHLGGRLDVRYIFPYT